MPEASGGHVISDPSLRRRCDELTRSLSKLEERYDDLRVSHAHLCDANSVLVHQLSSTSKNPASNADDHQGSWSLTQTFVMCLEGEEDKFAGQVRLLDKNLVSSVSSAVEKLNACEIQCPEGFCIVFSASSRAYFLLYRRDLEALVHSQFRAGEEDILNASVGAALLSTQSQSQTLHTLQPPDQPSGGTMPEQLPSGRTAPFGVSSYSMAGARSSSRNDLLAEHQGASPGQAQSSGTASKHSARRRNGASGLRSTSASKRARSSSGGAPPEGNPSARLQAAEGTPGGRREIRRLRAELSAWGDELQRREAEIARSAESGEELTLLRSEVAQQAESLRRIVELLRRGLREADLKQSSRSAEDGEAAPQSSPLLLPTPLPTNLPGAAAALQSLSTLAPAVAHGNASNATMSPPASTRTNWPTFSVQASARSPSRSSRSPPRSPLAVGPRSNMGAAASAGASTHRASQQKKPDSGQVPPGAPPSSPPRVVQPRGVDYGDGMSRRTMPARISLAPALANAQGMPSRATLGAKAPSQSSPKQMSTPKVAVRATAGDRWTSTAHSPGPAVNGAAVAGPSATVATTSSMMGSSTSTSTAVPASTLTASASMAVTSSGITGASSIAAPAIAPSSLAANALSTAQPLTASAMAAAPQVTSLGLATSYSSATQFSQAPKSLPFSAAPRVATLPTALQTYPRIPYSPGMVQ